MRYSYCYEAPTNVDYGQNMISFMKSLLDTYAAQVNQGPIDESLVDEIIELCDNNMTLFKHILRDAYYANGFLEKELRKSLDKHKKLLGRC